MVEPVRAKYRSASGVHAGSVRELHEALIAEPTCMVFLLVDYPGDDRMAYQHTARSSFVTAQGVSKCEGARRIASDLGIALEHSVGAGDAPTDDFLSEVGYAVIVGNASLDFKGRLHTARVAGVAALGDLLALIEREDPR